MLKTNFLHGYIKFKDDEDWNKINFPSMWIEGDYNDLAIIMQQQKVAHYLMELIPCPDSITPDPRMKIMKIQKEGE